jgi:Amt family ammonium transporter
MIRTPYRRFSALIAAAIAFAAMPLAPNASAQETAPPAPAAVETPAAPAPAATLEQRVADLESYVNNSAPGGEEGNSWTPNVGSTGGPGHSAWMMTSAVLVLFMTLPGLALFYGGLVRKKNVLSVLAQCMGIAGLVTILWWACGYSLTFGTGNAFIGDFSAKFLEGVTSAPKTLAWVPENVFAIFQLTFAIITPALMVGAIAERMKFSAVLLFVAIWMFAVYFPFAHMVWGGGLMAGVAGTIKAIDFAGGTVVHMTSGYSALILCIILGKRRGYGKEPLMPHNLVLCTVGTGMLWVGWYGFNAGSAGAADGIAASAFTTTTLCAAVAGFAWAVTEWLLKGKPSVLGFCSGIVAGLVVITPAAGFVTANSSVIMGVLAGVIPFLAVAYLKNKLGYDDALDTFGIHGVGGTLGAILTGIFADASVNGGVADVKEGLVVAQLQAVGVTIVWSVVATVVIAFIVKAIVGLRVSPEVEEGGLDLAEHGEAAYEH